MTTDDHASLAAAGYREVPAAAVEGTGRRWWDANAGEYLDEHGAFLGDADFCWSPEGLREADARLLGDVAGRRVLEVGAGAAQCSRWLATHGALVVATDVSAGMLVRGAALDARALAEAGGGHGTNAPGTRAPAATGHAATNQHPTGRLDAGGQLDAAGRLGASGPLDAAGRLDASGPLDRAGRLGAGGRSAAESGAVESGAVGGRTTPVPLVQADARALPFPDESFDVVFTAYGAIPFVADARRVHAEAARVLRPGGRWVCAVTHPVRWAFPDDPGERGLTADRSYFDRRPYVETDDLGRVLYAEYHRTIGDHIADIVASGLVLDAIVEPEWPPDHDRTWGGWSPLRGARLPGTAIFVTHRP